MSRIESINRLPKARVSYHTSGKGRGGLMATVLVYRNDGDRPFCEIALDDGDRVQLQLDQSGLVIERQALGDRPGEVLFKGDAALVGDMCAALLGPVPAQKITPLDVLTSVVVQMRSAADVRAAFRDAAKAL